MNENNILTKLPLAQRKELIDGILMRWCALYGVKRISHLARFFDFSPGDPSVWKHRGNIPYEWLHRVVEDKKIEGVTFEWLLTGDAPIELNVNDIKTLELGIFKALVDAPKYNLLPREMQKMPQEQLAMLTQFFIDKIAQQREIESAKLSA